jgi:DnaJ homolog subfamily C member 19
MLWLLLGTAILTILLLGLRAFERASVGTIYTLLKWIAAFGGIALTLLLFVSGRGAQALGGLVFLGPLLWRRWHHRSAGFSQFSSAGTPPPPPRQSSSMTRQEAYEVLGLKPGADEDAIPAAHRRLMRTAHPDAGGSDWLASRVNQARDVLLG